MGRRLTAVVCAAALLAALCAVGVASAEGPVVVQAGNGPEFNGGVSPKSVPAGRSVPATLRFSYDLTPEGGPHPPAMTEFELDLDRDLSLTLGQLPTCRLPSGGIDEYTPCGKSPLIGEGWMDISIAFPESQEIFTGSKLRFYNGGLRSGERQILARAYITIPTPAAIVMDGEVRRDPEGRFGTEIDFKMPKIAGGSGSITAIRATIHGLHQVEGKRVEVLSERCRAGRLSIGVRAGFADGTTVTEEAVRPCTPIG